MDWIDDAGIRLPLELEETVELEVDGCRVWDFVPPRDGRRADDRWQVDWPTALAARLDGFAEFRLKRLRTGEVLHESTVRLGSGEGRLDLRDQRGRPLAVDKAGRLTAMFAEADDELRGGLVDAVSEALAFMQDRGYDAFLAFGNLLGAIRDGRLIGHDNDADTVVLSKATHPVDVIFESMQLERAFQEAGWPTRRMSGADFKVIATLPHGGKAGIDVFSAFYFQDTLHIMPCIAADLPRTALLPTSTVRLEGREVPAPADPEAVLAATYGPDWRVPDPSFKYDPPRWLKRRLSGYMRGERRHAQYWQTFYRFKASRVPTEPSSFATWVAEQQPRPTRLVDVGCGTARDSLWLSGQGIDVVGCDYSPAGLDFAREQAATQGLGATFRGLNLYDLRHVVSLGALMAAEDAPDAVYARFLVHALEDDGRKNLWRFSRAALRPRRGRLYLEFRTEATQHEFGEHYRQFVQPNVVCEELKHYGFGIEHCEDRYGLAVHREEDPRVCRIVAKMED
jgi:SAM-dependent methyltransferase